MKQNEMKKRIVLDKVIAAPVHRIGRPELFSKLQSTYGTIHTLDTGSTNLLLFTEEAIREFMTLIHWGRNTPMNIDETQLSLIGRFFMHGEGADGGFTAVCEYVLPVSPGKRSAVSAQMSSREEMDKDRTLHVLNRNLSKCDPSPLREFGEYQHLGYAHTHPGNLQVFFSSTDTEDFKRMFDKEGVSGGVAVVANPQRKKIAAFGGKTAQRLSIAFALKKTGNTSELSLPIELEPVTGTQLSGIHEGPVKHCETRIDILPSTPSLAAVETPQNNETSCRGEVETEQRCSERPFFYCNKRILLEQGVIRGYSWIQRKGVLKVVRIERNKLTRQQYASGYEYRSRVYCLDGSQLIRCLDIVSKGKRPPLSIKGEWKPNDPFDVVLKLRRCDRMDISW